MTADTLGGVWTYSLELARALAPYDIDFVIATMGAPPTTDQLAELRAIPNVTLYTSEYKLEWMEDPWEDVEAAGRWLMELEQREQPDIIHLNGYAHGSLNWSSPCLMVGHSCVLSWWEAVKGEPAPISWERYKGEIKRGLQSAQLVICPSQAMLTALERHYGPFDAAKVVQNSLNESFFKSCKKEPFVFSAGRVWDEAKNIATLERIAPSLSWPVYVAGEEGGQLTLSGVHRLGRLGSQAMAHWYSRASIYALPARYEPFGLSALEAALSGCALVLGDIPSLREVWSDAAIFVQPNDQQALEKAINGLISDKKLLVEMSQRANTRALYYKPEHMAEGYMAAIRQLMI